jgi:hypothetical protein
MKLVKGFDELVHALLTTDNNTRKKATFCPFVDGKLEGGVQSFSLP